MRKISLVSGIMISVVFLSGCSLPGIKPASETETKLYDFSASIWRSDDGGIKWEAKNKSVNKPARTNVDVLSLAVNPNDGNNVFAGLMSGGILRTDNGGDTWKFLNFPPEKVYGLAIDPRDSRIIYASGVFEGRGKIYSSMNGGEEWKEIYTSASTGPMIIFLAVDPMNPGIIYAATSDNQVIKSVDSGFSWKNVFSENTPVLKVAIDNFNNNVVYLMDMQGRVFASLDALSSPPFQVNVAITPAQTGVQQVSPSAPAGVQEIKDMITDPSHAGWAYLIGRGGIVVTHDEGKTWARISPLQNPDNFPVLSLAVNPWDSGNIVYGAAQASYRSVDGGENWTPFQFDTKKSIRTIKFNTQKPNVLYLGLRAE